MDAIKESENARLVVHGRSRIQKSTSFEDRMQLLKCNDCAVSARCSINVKQTLTVAALRDAPLVALSHISFPLCFLR